MQTPSELYQSFFNPIKKKAKELNTNFGRDIVYDNIGSSGGCHAYPAGPNSKTVYIPADSGDFSSSRLLVEIGIGTSSLFFARPELWEKQGDGSPNKTFLSGTHPGNLPPGKRKECKETVLKNLQRLEEELSKTIIK